MTTDVRDDLRDVLADRAGSARLSDGFGQLVQRSAKRRHRNRRLGATALAASVAVVAVSVASLAVRAGGDDRPTQVVAGPAEGAATDVWVPMPHGPLSARDGALSFAVGDELLIFGGRPEAGCPSGADCRAPVDQGLTDGAAYNPATQTWRPIADTPMPISSASGAVIGDRLYLWAAVQMCPPANEFCLPIIQRFVAYDVGDDVWSELPLPDGPIEGLRLAADGDTVVGYHEEANGGVAPVRYDPATGGWTTLLIDPLQPGFDRVVVAHQDNLYLFSVPSRASRPDPDDPGYYQAALLEVGANSWQRLPDSPVDGFSATWALVGDLIVNPLPPAPPGTEGRTFPPGGTLDTITGEWSSLPPAPTPVGPYYGLGTVVGDPFIASYGFILDALLGTWTPLPIPNEVADQGTTAAWVGNTLVVWGGTRDGATTDVGATWTVDVAQRRLPDDDDAFPPQGLPSPEMQAALDAGVPVVIDEDADLFCSQHPESAGFSCGRLDKDRPSISTGWNDQEGRGFIVVVDGRRRLDRLEVLDASGRIVRTLASMDDGLYLRAPATQMPETVRIVARDGTVLRTLHPIDMEAANQEAVAASDDAAD